MDNVFFFISKLVWLLVSPDNLLLLWLFSAVFLLFTGRYFLAKKLLTTLTLVCTFIALFPVGEWLIYPLESTYQVNPPLEHLDGIILLSGAEETVKSAHWNQAMLNGAADRSLAFMHLAKRFPHAQLVFTGGTGSLLGQQYKAASVAEHLFSQQGMDIKKIIFEKQSRNTWENAVFSKKLVQPKPDEKWALITTGWHMPRSVGVFCKVGWSVLPYPVDFNSRRDDLFRADWNFSGHLSNLVTGVKEWVGLFAYRFSGKSC